MIINNILKFISPRIFYKMSGVIMGKNVFISRTAKLDSEPYLIEIGNNTKITSRVRFVTHDGGIFVVRNLKNMQEADVFGTIKIGNNVFIGNNATIMPNVIIGDNVIVGFGSIVTKNIPDNEVWAGVPAKKICSIEEYYEKNKNKILFTKKMKHKEKKRYLLKKIKERKIL